MSMASPAAYIVAKGLAHYEEKIPVMKEDYVAAIQRMIDSYTSFANGLSTGSPAYSAYAQYFKPELVQRWLQGVKSKGVTKYTERIRTVAAQRYSQAISQPYIAAKWARAFAAVTTLPPGEVNSIIQQVLGAAAQG